MPFTAIAKPRLVLKLVYNLGSACDVYHNGTQRRLGDFLLGKTTRLAREELPIFSPKKYAAWMAKVRGLD
jgi:hypothetical protein